MKKKSVAKRLTSSAASTYILRRGYCLRHCAKSRKVAGSIPEGVMGDSSSIQSFRLHYGPGVDSPSKRNEYQWYLLEGAGLTTLPCLEILVASTLWSPQGLSRPVKGFLSLTDEVSGDPLQRTAHYCSHTSELLEPAHNQPLMSNSLWYSKPNMSPLPWQCI